MRLPRKVNESSINEETPPERRDDFSRMILRNLLRGFPLKSLLWNHPLLGWCPAPHSDLWQPTTIQGGRLWRVLESSPSFPLFIEYFLVLALWITRSTKVHLRLSSRCWYMATGLTTLPQALYSWMHRPEGLNSPQHEGVPLVQGCLGLTEWKEETPGVKM